MPSRHEESQIQIQNQVLESLKSLPSKIQQGWKLFYCIKQNFDVSFFFKHSNYKNEGVAATGWGSERSLHQWNDADVEVVNEHELNGLDEIPKLQKIKQKEERQKMENKSFPGNKNNIFFSRLLRRI